VTTACRLNEFRRPAEREGVSGVFSIAGGAWDGVPASGSHGAAMSVIDVEKYLTEIAPDAPAGPDVEYDPEYFELEKLAQGTPESQMGEEKIAAEEPKWSEVKEAALKLGERTRDMRVALIMTLGLLKEDGIPGFRDGMAVIRGLVDRMWEHFYPKLDPDDNNDPTIRINLIHNLNGDGSSADMYKFKQRLREATLTNSPQRIGKFSLRDIQIASGEIPAPPQVDGAAPPPTTELVNAAFEDTATEHLQEYQTLLQETLDDLAAMEAALSEKIGDATGPDLAGLKEVLESLKGVMDTQLDKRGIGSPEAATEGEAGVEGEDGESGAGMRRGISGEITSREDVIRMLDKINNYYEKYEPGSPVPIFMARAKRLVTMNFVDLIKDLAPDAMEKISVFTGEAAGGEAAE
jgi:type VI secretion system protein ImpA